MAFMKISGTGLGSIAMLVTLLWACILGEHLIVERANRELSAAMSNIRLMQRRRIGPLPVSLPGASRPVRSTIG
jgi:hypothetical protein